MNIESLTKSQIVLLTLLVSFVTSIATGITTVALMDQAPPAITQTINRVVEHTVERVVPVQTQPAAAAAAIKETVIVKQSDAIAAAVADASPSIVRISIDEDTAPIAVGLVLTGSLIITDSAVVKSGAHYYATLVDGTVIALEGGVRTEGPLAAFTIERATSTPDLTPIAVQRSAPTLGETVVALTGLRTPRIASGIITSIIPGAVASSTDATSVNGSFETSINLDPLAAGSVFISTDGALVGIYTSKDDSIVPAALVSMLRAAPETDDASN